MPLRRGGGRASSFNNGFERTDSRVFLAHAVLSWLANAFWALLIWLKLTKHSALSWWVVFLPRWVAYALLFPLHALVISRARDLVRLQIGPPPPVDTSHSLYIQYSKHERRRIKSHILRNIISAVDALSQLCVKLAMCWQLENLGEKGWGSFRVTFIPFWLAWFITNCLNIAKDKQERAFGSVQELHYIFFLFVACKLDGVNMHSWKVVFIIPFVCYTVVNFMALMILFMLVSSRRPLRERILQLGIFCLFMSFTPQFVSYLRLVTLLDGDAGATVRDIMLPNVVSWFMLFGSSLIIWWGLLMQERCHFRWLSIQQLVLEQQYEAEVLQAEQASVLEMTDEQLEAAAEALLVGKVRPVELYRVSKTLFRRVQAGYADSNAPSPAREAAACDEAGKSSSNDLESQAGGSMRQCRLSSVSIEMNPIMMAAGMGMRSESLESNRSEPNGARTPTLSNTQRQCRGDKGTMVIQPEPAPTTSVASTARIPQDGEKLARRLDNGKGRSVESLYDMDDGTCIICFDEQASCVFLDCGHAGVCKLCAYKLWLRPPHECPNCRAKISQVVEIENCQSAAGLARVKIYDDSPLPSPAS